MCFVIIVLSVSLTLGPQGKKLILHASPRMVRQTRYIMLYRNICVMGAFTVAALSGHILQYAYTGYKCTIHFISTGNKTMYPYTSDKDFDINITSSMIEQCHSNAS